MNNLVKLKLAVPPNTSNSIMLGFFFSSNPYMYNFKVNKNVQILRPLAHPSVRAFSKHFLNLQALYEVFAELNEKYFKTNIENIS